jgi:hypothetical protein
MFGDDDDAEFGEKKTISEFTLVKQKSAVSSGTQRSR